MMRFFTFILMTLGALFLFFMLALYGLYFVSFVKELSAPRENPFTLEELIPALVAAGLFSCFILFCISAFCIRMIAIRKGAKSFLVQLCRLVFLISFAGFIALFFVSAVYVEQYVQTISKQHGYLICMRNQGDMKLMSDILLLPDSAEACYAFQLQGRA